MNKKKVIVSVTNDLATDQRVKRSIDVLLEQGFEVCFVGRLLPESLAIDVPYETRRFKLWFNKGFLFYANYNIRLFLFLLFKHFDLYWSNDLDTLLPNYLVSKLKGKPLVYDSHEYFTGVPEIQDRPTVKRIWKFVERITMPSLKHFITVNNSIAKLYKSDYGLEATVVRNISDSNLPRYIKSREELGLPTDKFILINQGSGINMDRGMEEVMDALPFLKNVVLVLVGKGDVYPLLKERAQSPEFKDKVIFVDPQPYLEMLQYTLNADCGLTLDKPNNLNYKYSLPNKLFDYVKCGIPMVASNVVEVQYLVKTYQLGEVVNNHERKTLVGAVEEIRKKGKGYFGEGLRKAAEQNNWELEQEVLRKLIKNL
jgi:glycosyltransferase involved in cell wall biosynthesis